MESKDLMDKIVSLAKRRGFVYQGSEIYGGLAGTWDYGPLGVALKNNIKNAWRKKFIDSRDDMYEVDAALLMNPKVWETSGHVAGFSDPLVECKSCHKRFRPDQIENFDIVGVKGLACPNCLTLKAFENSEVRQFNMMFQTKIGASEDSAATVYFRPETAQGMFVNFKNILDSFAPKLPFGMAQIGKAFRNEITPKDFIFRVREFEQMEIEYFVDPRDEKKINKTFDELYDQQIEFLNEIGIDNSKLHKIDVPDADRAHYSKRSVDTEFDFPFGQKELLGLAYRTDYDLGAHQKASGVSLSIFDEETKEKFVPHCIEPTFGVERLILALLTSAYKEDEQGGEVRSYLAFKPSLAPVICAVSPLLKNRPELQEKAREVYAMLKKDFGRVMYDDNGNVGKRYRRQDEIGTPWCIVVDFDTIGQGENINPDWKDMVTIRDRDTGTQERVAINDLASYIKSRM